VIQADLLFVQNQFNSEVSRYYGAVAMLGVGLVSFTAPMAAVMFPKLVSSFVQSQKTNSLALALAGTALLAGLGALVCTVLPWLPLRILHFNKPDLWVSAELVPWFMWAMLPVTLANVLTSNLLAQQRFWAVPWLIAIAVAYGFNLRSYLSEAALILPHFAVFKGVIFRLGVFSSLLLLVSLIFTLWPRKGTAS
jgi:O-antigen/teichoic acid export membrane protein